MNLGTRMRATMKHLDLLESETIIQHRVSGTMKFFRCANTLKARATMRLMEEWSSVRLARIHDEDCNRQ